MRIVLLFSLLVLAPTTGAAADVQERYAELQAVPEAINDPDPLMRLAQLEAIVAEKDATKVQLALRTAFTVDDPNVWALALRAHLATYKTIILTADLPPDIKADLESSDSEAGSKYRDHLSFLDTVGYQFVIEMLKSELNGVEFPVVSMNEFNEQYKEKYVGSGNVRGSTISIRAPVKSNNSYYTCSFELSEYEGFTVSGIGSCDNASGSFPFPVTMRLF